MRNLRRTSTPMSPPITPQKRLKKEKVSSPSPSEESVSSSSSLYDSELSEDDNRTSGTLDQKTEDEDQNENSNSACQDSWTIAEVISKYLGQFKERVEKLPVVERASGQSRKALPFFVTDSDSETMFNFPLVVRIEEAMCGPYGSFGNDDVATELMKNWVTNKLQYASQIISYNLSDYGNDQRPFIFETFRKLNEKIEEKFGTLYTNKLPEEDVRLIFSKNPLCTPSFLYDKVVKALNYEPTDFRKAAPDPLNFWKDLNETSYDTRTGNTYSYKRIVPNQVSVVNNDGKSIDGATLQRGDLVLVSFMIYSYRSKDGEVGAHLFAEKLKILKKQDEMDKLSPVLPTASDSPFKRKKLF